VTGVDKFYLDFCNAFILVDLTCKEDAGFESESPSINLKGIIERNRDGKDGVTPRIDPGTKRWMIGIEDTGIVAEGKDGLTPTIGENGKAGGSGTLTRGNLPVVRLSSIPISPRRR